MVVVGIGIWGIGAASEPTYVAVKSARYRGTSNDMWAFIRKQPTENVTGVPNFKIVSENVNHYLAIGVQSPNFDIHVLWEYQLTPVSKTVTETQIRETLTVKNTWIRGLLVLTGRNAQLKQEHRRLADQFEFAE